MSHTPEQTARELAVLLKEKIAGCSFYTDEVTELILTHLQPLYSTIADNDIAYKGLTQTLEFCEKELELSESRIERMERLLERVEAWHSNLVTDESLTDIMEDITSELQKGD